LGKVSTGTASADDRLAEARAYNAALADVLRAIARSPSEPESVLASVLEHAMRLCHSSSGVLWRREGEKFAVAVSRAASPDFERAAAEGQPTTSGGGVTARVTREKRPIQIRDMLEDPAHGDKDNARLGGYRTLLGVPLMRGEEVIGVIALARLEVRDFSEEEIALVASFADQAAIAIQSVRLLGEVEGSLDQQTAVAEILKSISASGFDLGRVLQTVTEHATRLSGATQGILYRRDGEVLVFAAGFGPSGELMELSRRHPIAVGDRGTLLGRVATDRRTIHLPDVLQDPEYTYYEAQRLGGFRAMLGVPLLSGDEVLGTMSLWRTEPLPFTDAQIAIVETFARQASVAMQNVRLWSETNEALGQQTAISEVLRTISRSAFDLDAVLQTIVERAAALGGADSALIARRDGDMAVVLAQFGPVLPSSLRPGMQIPVSHGTIIGRALLTGQRQYIPDSIKHPDLPQDGPRTRLAIPFLRDGNAIGVLSVSHVLAQPFSDRELGMLETFADQAAIAMENVRLFSETKEALEQQTATADVLTTISRSAFDLQSVFDVVVENATKLCRGDWGYLFRRDGDVFRIVSSFGGTAELLDYERAHPTPLSRSTLIGRVALDRAVVHLPDLFEDPAYDWPSNRAAGVHTVLGVPIFKDNEVVGAIGVARNEKRPFTDAEIRLVRTFADQAAIAMENVRLFNETKAALERQTAISEILRVIASSPSDEKPVLDTIAKSATRFCGANDAVVFLVNGDHFDMAAHHGSVPLWRDRIAQADVPSMTVSRETLVGRAVLDRRTMTITDALGPEADPFPHARHSARELGQRAILATPLIREDRPIGAIVLRKTEPIAFTTDQISLVEAFADQAVIAIENVRLFNETKEALAQQTATADVLDVVSKSAFAIEPVFQAIVDRAAHLFVPPPFAIILQRDGTDLIVRALFPVEEESHFDVGQRITPDRTTGFGRAFLDGSVAHIADPAADPETRRMNGTRLGVPIIRNREVFGVIGLARDGVHPFSEGEIRLVQTFASQAAIAIANVSLFNDTKAALERQTATAGILEVISRSTSDLQPVLDTVVAHAERLCAADYSFVFLRGEDGFHIAAWSGGSPELVALEKMLTVQPSRAFLVGRVALEGRPVQIPDVLADPEYGWHEGQKVGGYRTMLGVPLLRGGTVAGVVGVFRNEVAPFTTEQIELLRTFADQAVIAIENVRLFNETKEALERQTATSSILNVISRSPADQQPTLDAIVKSGARLCDADMAFIYVVEGGFFKLRAGYKVPAAFVEYTNSEPVPVAPHRGSLSGRVVAERRAVQIPDVLEDPEYTYREGQRLVGYRAMLNVPMFSKGELIGLIGLWRTAPVPFTTKQIDLMSTFADQAVIAIENTRLFNETKEALERQTSISDVLQTIGRSAFDLQPVLDTVAERAVKLCDAQDGSISTLEGDVYRTRAFWSVSSLPPEYIDFMRQEVRTPERGSLVGRTALEGRVVQIVDVLEDPEYKAMDMQQAAGYRTVLGVPLLRDGSVIGVFALTRGEVRPFTDRQIELVRTFADQAAIAIENTRLFVATKEALEQQTAVAEVLKTISRSTFDLQPVLDIVLNNAVRLAGADIGWMSRVEDDQFLTVAYSSEFPATVRDELIRQRAHGHIGGPWVPLGTRGGVMGFTLSEGRTIHVPDLRKDPELKDSVVAKLSESRTVIGVPMLREGQTIGGMVLARYDVRPFSEREVELVQTFADQAAIAIGNVRLFNEIQDKSQQLEAASRHKSEFLANMSHELRTPLNAIIGFSEVLLQGIFGDVNEKQREYLQDVLGSGQHLLSLINDILDLSKIEAGRMDLELTTFSVRDALESGLTIVRERAARHGIALKTVLASNVGTIEADERKVKQILYNLLSNAVKFTPDGGRVDVNVRAENSDVRVEVRDTGIGIAPADQERIFEEFRQAGRERSREGTGLGLTLTKRFVELHGGRIWLESAPGEGSTFGFTIPLRRAAAVNA